MELAEEVEHMPFADPNDIQFSNPYYSPPPQPDKLSVLGNMLLGLGVGMNNATAQGNSAWAGVAPGAMFAGQLNGQLQQEMEREAAKRQQLALSMMAYKDKKEERDRKLRALQAFGVDMLGGGGGAPVGLNVQPGSEPQIMPPGAYGAKVAGYEGGSKNGGMIYNELGSGAYGPYQFMPGTWADVRASAPELGLPADMTQATRAQHDAAFQRFSQGNAKALQAAGIAPTPENLYLVHRFGAGGATAMLKAKPDAMLADVLPLDWQRQNPDMRGQSVAGFQRLAAERMRGVGVPYQANGETTAYTLQPDSLPPFAVPGGTGMQPGANSNPGATMTPVGYTMPPTPLPGQPQQVVPAQAGGAPMPQPSPMLSIPQPPMVPKPMLPANEEARINRMVQGEILTPEQGLAERNRIVNDLWTTQKEYAAKLYEQRLNEYIHQRGLRDSYAPVWDPSKGQMVLVPKAEMGKYLPPDELQRLQKERELGNAEKAQAQKSANDAVTLDANGNPTVNQTVPAAAAAKTAAEEEARRRTAIPFAASEKILSDEIARYSKDIRPGVEATAGSLPNLYEMKRLASGDLTSGTLANLRIEGSRILDTLGLKNMPESAVNTTEFLNRASKNVLSFLQTRALGSGSGISEGDRKFVEQMGAKDAGYSKVELQRLTDIAIQSAQLDLKKHDAHVNRLKYLPGVDKIPDGFWKVDAPSYDEWAKANPPTARATNSQGATAPAGMPSPASKAEYDALPAGTVYRHPDGTVKTKGGK